MRSGRGVAVVTLLAVPRMPSGLTAQVMRETSRLVDGAGRGGGSRGIHRDLVPISKLDIARTPIGPSPMTILGLSTAFSFRAKGFSPQSRPVKPSGMPSSSWRS